MGNHAILLTIIKLRKSMTVNIAFVSYDWEEVVSGLNSKGT